jgi:hypothetical protein
MEVPRNTEITVPGGSTSSRNNVAAIRGFKSAQSLRNSFGECTLVVPKQVRFRAASPELQRSSTLQTDKPGAALRADGTRDKFLSGACFVFDEDRGLRLGPQSGPDPTLHGSPGLTL